MKLIQVVNAHDVVYGFAEKENIGAHLAYTMTKFVVATQTDVDFYCKEMQKLFEKYGVCGDNDKLIIPSDKVADFQKEVTVLESTDVEIPSIRFSLSELAQELKLSMKQMYPLLDFIDEES